MPTGDGIEYEVYYCPVHKKHIHYFKANRAFKGYHCWDCNYESESKKEKYDERREQGETPEDQEAIRDDGGWIEESAQGA